MLLVRGGRSALPLTRDSVRPSQSRRALPAKKRPTDDEDDDDDDDEYDDEEEEEEDRRLASRTIQPTATSDFVQQIAPEEDLRAPQDGRSGLSTESRKSAPHRVRLESALRQLLRRFDDRRKQLRQKRRPRDMSKESQAREDDGEGEREEDEGITLRERLQSIVEATRLLPAATQKVFSKQVFKGVSLSFVKGLSDWKSCGMGVKIPITNHFPLYDSNMFLPRVVGFVGVNYPYSYKVAFTVSVPLQALQIFLLLLLQINPDVWPAAKATDNVKRVGFAWSCKISTQKGKSWYRQLSSSTTAVFNFIPGSRLIQKLLPFVIFTPALILSLGLYLLAVIVALVPSLVHALPTVFFDSAAYALSHPATLSQEVNREWRLENALMKRFEDAWRVIVFLLTKKALALGSTVNIVKGFPTASVNFDLQPFYLQNVRKLIVYLAITFPQQFFASLHRMVDMINRVHDLRRRRRHTSTRAHPPMNPSSMSIERMGHYAEGSRPGALLSPTSLSSASPLVAPHPQTNVLANNAPNNI